MRNIVLSVAAALILAGCVTPPVPEGYSGPLAKVQDTFTQRGDRAVDIFYLASINGKKIDNALLTTTSANAGRGFAMDAKQYTRDVPAQPATVTLTARTHYAAPILELTNPVYQVKGDIQFAPVAGHTYVVRGELRADYGAVWLEDAETKAVTGNKVEVKGDVSLGFMEK